MPWEGTASGPKPGVFKETTLTPKCKGWTVIAQVMTRRGNADKGKSEGKEWLRPHGSRVTEQHVHSTADVKVRFLITLRSLYGLWQVSYPTLDPYHSMPLPPLLGVLCFAAQGLNLQP